MWIFLWGGGQGFTIQSSGTELRSDEFMNANPPSLVPLPSFPTMLPGTTSQVNDLYRSPCLSLLLRENKAKITSTKSDFKMPFLVIGKSNG